jgi:GNAT superfamily N-acetyltransferase
MDQHLTFRVATESDLTLVVDLMKELIDELGSGEGNRDIKSRLKHDIAQALANDQVCIFLAFDNDDCVGLSRGDILSSDPIFRLRSDNRCGYVDQMFVRPSHRRTGIGAALLRHCEDWFKAQGIGHVLLHAAVRAIRFYARAGYQSNREMFKKLL